VNGLRCAEHVALGDEGIPNLVRRLRVHGNFGEYVPLPLILMLLFELQEKRDWLIHGVGIAILCGRHRSDSCCADCGSDVELEAKRYCDAVGVST
jgi:uncharacterized membrane protein YecN with MAPEG domain